MTTRLDRFGRTLSDISQRLTPTNASLSIEAEEAPVAGESTKADDSKPKRRKKAKRAASNAAALESSSDALAEEQAASGGEEPIMSFADIAQAIKGVQADYASYTPEKVDIGDAKAEASEASDGGRDACAVSATEEAAAQAPNATSTTNATSPDHEDPLFDQPRMAQAVPRDDIEAELIRAINAPDMPHGALETIAAELDRPLSGSADPDEPRSVDHSQPAPGSKKREETRPPGHGSDILYGIDDSGCWSASFRAAERGRGWHWFLVRVSFNANGWAAGISPNYFVQQT